MRVQGTALAYRLWSEAVVMGLFSRRRPVEGPCVMCGVLTSERNRAGGFEHLGHAARMAGLVYDEARRSTSPHDLAERLREQQERVRAAREQVEAAAGEFGASSFRLGFETAELVAAQSQADELGAALPGDRSRR